MPSPADTPGSSWQQFEPVQPAVPEAPKSSDVPSGKRGGCQFCKSSRFLRSTLRTADFGAILFLRYPVRCLRCRQRQFVDFMTASLALAAGSPVYNESRKRENWRTWTSGSDRKAFEALEKANQQSDSTAPPGN